MPTFSDDSVPAWNNGPFMGTSQEMLCSHPRGGLMSFMGYVVGLKVKEIARGVGRLLLDHTRWAEGLERASVEEIATRLQKLFQVSTERGCEDLSGFELSRTRRHGLLPSHLVKMTVTCGHHNTEGFGSGA